MQWKALVIGLLLVGCSRSAAAQTHICDQTSPTSGTAVEGAATFQWCEDGKDANGNPTTITRRNLYVDGSATPVTITGTPSGTPSPVSGKQLFTTGISLVRGTHTYAVSLNNATGEGAKSGLFTIAVSPPPTVPTAPALVGIKQP